MEPRMDIDTRLCELAVTYKFDWDEVSVQMSKETPKRWNRDECLERYLKLQEREGKEGENVGEEDDDALLAEFGDLLDGGDDVDVEEGKGDEREGLRESDFSFDASKALQEAEETLDRDLDERLGSRHAAAFDRVAAALGSSPIAEEEMAALWKEVGRGPQGETNAQSDEEMAMAMRIVMETREAARELIRERPRGERGREYRAMLEQAREGVDEEEGEEKVGKEDWADFLAKTVESSADMGRKKKKKSGEDGEDFEGGEEEEEEEEEGFFPRVDSESMSILEMQLALAAQATKASNSLPNTSQTHTPLSLSVPPEVAAFLDSFDGPDTSQDRTPLAEILEILERGEEPNTYPEHSSGEAISSGGAPPKTLSSGGAPPQKISSGGVRPKKLSSGGAPPKKLSSGGVPPRQKSSLPLSPIHGVRSKAPPPSKGKSLPHVLPPPAPSPIVSTPAVGEEQDDVAALLDEFLPRDEHVVRPKMGGGTRAEVYTADDDEENSEEDALDLAEERRRRKLQALKF